MNMIWQQANGIGYERVFSFDMPPDLSKESGVLGIGKYPLAMPGDDRQEEGAARDVVTAVIRHG